MGSRLSTDARLITSTTLLIRGSPLAEISRRSRASAEPRYRAGSFPSALYPARVDTTAELSSTERGSGSLAMRSSHARSSSSSAAGAAPVFTSASTQPRAAFGHLAFNSPEILISVIAPQLNRTIQDLRHCQLLQAPDVRHQPLNFLELQTLSIGRHFVFSFFDHRPQSASDLPATAGSLKLTTPMLFPAGESPLPLAPWQTAHFALYKVALFSSAFARALKPYSRKSAASATIPVRNEIMFAPLRITKCCVSVILINTNHAYHMHTERRNNVLKNDSVTYRFRRSRYRHHIIAITFSRGFHGRTRGIS